VCLDLALSSVDVGGRTWVEGSIVQRAGVALPEETIEAATV